MAARRKGRSGGGGCLLILAGVWLSDPENRETLADFRIVRRHISKGGCMKDFNEALNRCRYDSKPDAEACIQATAALRKCFAAKPDWFGDAFTVRMDQGLDQDLTPSQIELEKSRPGYRWWTGMMRRS